MFHGLLDLVPRGINGTTDSDGRRLLLLQETLPDRQQSVRQHRETGPVATACPAVGLHRLGVD